MALRFSLPNHSSFTLPTATTTNRNPSKRMVQAFAGATTVPQVNTRKSENLYQVLRVQQSASSTEIKTAYRNLVKHFHPDVARCESSSTSDFIEIQKAYETLYDPIARGKYDFSIQEGDRRFHHQSNLSSKVGYGYGYGYGGELKTRRWETDQCW